MRQPPAVALLLLLLLRFGESWVLQEVFPPLPEGSPLPCLELWLSPTPWSGLGLQHMAPFPALMVGPPRQVGKSRCPTWGSEEGKVGWGCRHRPKRQRHGQGLCSPPPTCVLYSLAKLWACCLCCFSSGLSLSCI